MGLAHIKAGKEENKMLALQEQQTGRYQPINRNHRVQEIHYAQVIIYDFETDLAYSTGEHQLEVPTMDSFSVPTTSDVARHMAKEYGVALFPSRYVATAQEEGKLGPSSKHLFVAAITSQERQLYGGSWLPLEERIFSED